MPKLSADAKLFGMDLNGVWAEVQGAWMQLVFCMRLDRLLPAAQVHVRRDGVESMLAQVRGSRWIRCEPQKDLPASGRSTPAFMGVLLGAEQLLYRTLALPPMPASALRDALALEVQTMSPFRVQDTLWTYARLPAHPHAENSVAQDVCLVMTSQALVQQALGLELAQSASPLEVWVEVPGASPALLPGFGEGPRKRKELRQIRWMIAGLLVICGLIAGLGVTPSAQLRMRALDADSQIRRLGKETAEVAAQRQSIQTQAQEVMELKVLQDKQLDHLRVLQVLTQLLPDDTALQRVTLKGSKLTIQGLSDNASRVVQLLSAAPGFREVRLPSAVTRTAGSSGKENFVLEAELNAAVFGVQATSAKPSPSAGDDDKDAS